VIDTARCHKCKRQFPDHLIDNFIWVEHGEKKEMRVCPICALDLKNKVHGTKLDHFTGPIAQSMLNQARAYLEDRKRWNNG
jgi:NAD-dependent SIR2 family protein deacetylase